MDIVIINTLNNKELLILVLFQAGLKGRKGRSVAFHLVRKLDFVINISPNNYKLSQRSNNYVIVNDLIF